MPRRDFCFRASETQQTLCAAAECLYVLPRAFARALCPRLCFRAAFLFLLLCRLVSLYLRRSLPRLPLLLPSAPFRQPPARLFPLSVPIRAPFPLPFSRVRAPCCAFQIRAVRSMSETISSLFIMCLRWVKFAGRPFCGRAKTSHIQYIAAAPFWSHVRALTHIF